MVGVRTHAECRRNETMGKEERQMNSIRPEMLVLYGREKIGIAGPKSLGYSSGGIVCEK